MQLTPGQPVNKSEVKTGLYWYRMPHWNKSVPVYIEESNGEKFVRFSNRFIPERMSEVPPDAIFEEI